MTFIEEFRERRERKRERIRKVLFGDTPRPSHLERVLLIFTIVAGAYLSYRYQLVRAHTFTVLGFSFVFLYFVVRRIWWSLRKPAHKAGGPS